ncbi:MAG: HD domain-containing protein [bacterium]|nr:HD domain-containing protein [bacterium]
MNKSLKFSKELEYIKSEKIKNACQKMIELLPDYFFEVPASSTGKYHPEYALGEGGLLRHTKAAVRIAYELLNDPCIGDKYTQDEKDLMIMALILHDGLKSGLNHEKYTRFDHPILIADYIMDNEEELGLGVEEIEFLCDAVKTHMGSWTTDYNGVEVLEKPKTKYQNFVHMCDYLASRKCLLVPFDKNDDISV